MSGSGRPLTPAHTKGQEALFSLAVLHQRRSDCLTLIGSLLYHSKLLSERLLQDEDQDEEDDDKYEEGHPNLIVSSIAFFYLLTIRQKFHFCFFLHNTFLYLSLIHI